MISLSKLKEKQLTKIENKYRLEDRHLIRLLPYIGNIFGDKCSTWNSKENIQKDCYVVININSQHYALHRILYINYINPLLKKGRYIGRVCKNNMCICLKHLFIKNPTEPIEKKGFPTDTKFTVDFE